MRFNQKFNFQRETIQHPGLWFDKYLCIKNDKEDAAQQKQVHVKNVALLAEPSLYKKFYQEWEAAILAYRTDEITVQSGTASTLGRLAIGLGNESVIETAITLHHTYGMPYIPGSALKGVAAHFAHQRLGAEWQKGSDAYEIVFGYVEKKDEKGRPVLSDAGFVTFFDALYIPGTGKNGAALHPDIVTVHHPDYYNQETPTAPADWDSPTPIPFLTATGQYFVALAGPAAWVTAAFMILQWALAEYGVGAKTSSGYGRMKLELPPPDPQTLKAQALVERVRNLPSKKVASEIDSIIKEWRKLEASMHMKRQVAVLIIQKAREVWKEQQLLQKAWYQEVLATTMG